MAQVLVAGAGGALGFAIAEILHTRGHDVIATYRTERSGLKDRLKTIGVEAVQVDLQKPDSLKAILNEADSAIFTPILTVSHQAASLLRDGQRAIFFSSNNVAIDPEDAVYAALLEAEEATRAAAPNATIIRPTMIYGYPGDGNLSQLMSSMRRWPIIPIPGKGEAKQQPVYFRDLAEAAVNALMDPATPKAITVAGPEPMTQKTLYRTAANAIGARPIIASLPTTFAANAVSALAGLGISLPVKPAQLTRAGRDKLPHGDHIITTTTSLPDGLKALAADLDDQLKGA